MRGPMQDLGAGPLWAVILWRDRVQSTVLHRGRAQIYTAALTRELSTFANVRDEICSFWRERSLLTMKFIWRFYWIIKRKVYLAKMNNLPKHHGAGPQRRGAQCSCIGCIGLRPALSGYSHGASVSTQKEETKVCWRITRRWVATRYWAEERNVFFAGQSDRRINFDISTASCTSCEMCLPHLVQSFGW